MVNGKNETKNKYCRLSRDGKRVACVKWNGKTIALGTFPDETTKRMCQRARVLTKSWRQMCPKPSVEKVKYSLEKLGIRVVNDRPGRQAKSKQQRQHEQHSSKEKTSEGVGSSDDTMLTHTPTERPDLRLSASTLHPSSAFIPIALTPLTKNNLNNSNSNNSSSNSLVLPVPYSNPNTVQLGIKPNVDDPDIDQTYATLKRHYRNLTEEREYTKELIFFYNHQTDQRRLERRLRGEVERRLRGEVEREDRERELMDDGGANKRFRRDGEDEDVGRDEDLLSRKPNRSRIEDDNTNNNNNNNSNTNNITNRPSVVMMNDLAIDIVPI